jgi:hypothetical protein
LTGLYQSVLQIKTKIVSSHTADSKPVKQEVNHTGILPPLVFPAWTNALAYSTFAGAILTKFNFLCNFQIDPKNLSVTLRKTGKARHSEKHSSLQAPFVSYEEA